MNEVKNSKDAITDQNIENSKPRRHPEQLWTIFTRSHNLRTAELGLCHGSLGSYLPHPPACFPKEEGLHHSQLPKCSSRFSGLSRDTCLQFTGRVNTTGLRNNKMSPIRIHLDLPARESSTM